MKEVTRSITVDLLRRGNARLVFAKQNDVKSRRLHISLTEDGVPYPVSRSATVLINYMRPDQKSGAGEATVLEDGRVEATLSLWALSIAGEVRCSISIFDGEARLTSDEFILDVSESLYDGKDITSESYSIFAAHISKMNEIMAVEEERVIAESERASAEKAREAAENEREASSAEQFAIITEKVEELDKLQGEISEQENYRIVSEEQRSLAEAERIAAEEARLNAENARDSQEALRIETEKARESAELERQALFTKYGKADGISIDDHNAYYYSETVEGALDEIGASLNELERLINNAQDTANEATQSANDALGIRGTLIIKTSDWSDELTFTANIEDANDNDMISIIPSSSSDKSTAEDIELFASPQANGGNILFSAKHKPSHDITLYYFIARGKEAYGGT